MTSEQEGVIKYKLVFHQREAVLDHDLSALTHWHKCFKKAGILGQDPGRYGGLGFGNISERLGEKSFLISGTQTGHLDSPGPTDYALVTSVDIPVNRVEAQGWVKPSSESLTHAAVYALDPAIRFVFHVHSPDIWNRRDHLGLAQTSVDIGYGTPQMANEMGRLYQKGVLQDKKLLAMSGHEDGIIGFASTASGAGEAIMNLLTV